MLNWRLVGKKWAHWLHFFPDGVSYHEEPQDMFVPPPHVLTTLLTPKIVLATEDIVQSLKSVVLKLVLVCWAWKVEKVHLTLFLLIIHNKKRIKNHIFKMTSSSPFLFSTYTNIHSVSLYVFVVVVHATPAELLCLTDRGGFRRRLQ